jgi:UDP-N-acetyl-2-amino-2-deoxyglucuronate dehydrogenase
MEKLKTGIIGCGKVGGLHAGALAGSKYSVFTAVCDSDRARADAFAARWGAKAYTDPAEMVRRESLGAVVVCTPHPFHAAPAVAAIEAGAHVLVEKPLASSLADCDAMIAAAERAGVQLGTVSQRRFYAPCQRIRKAIDAGKLGRPVLGAVTMYGWRDEKYYKSDPWRGTWVGEGGGVLVNQAPHQLDLLGWFMGPVEELFGYWDNLNHPYIEVEDTAVAVLRFANGGLGNILVSNSQNPALYGRVLISGSNGACAGVQTDGGAMFVAGMSDIEEPPVNDHWTVPSEQHLLVQWQRQDAEFFKTIKPTQYYHQLQIDDFLSAVIEGHPPLVSGRDGRRTVEIFTAIYRSRRDRNPIRFPLQPEIGDATFDGRQGGHP